MHYKKETLPNGLRVVFEEIPYVQSLSIGIWVGAGTRDEDRFNNGISHFIEHMMFKGTETRSAKDIAEQVDNIGGQLNAFTGKECTCYYAKVLNSHLELAFDILSDMMFRSLFSEKDIEKEKNVVIEEINMYEDNPEELVHDLYAANILKGHSLGFPVLGTKKTVKAYKREDILSYLNRFYRPDNTVISVAGNADFERIVEYAKVYFGEWGEREKSPIVLNEPSLNFGHQVKKKDTEQVHFCLGFKGLDQRDKNLYSFLALNNLLGGGMSSRLFQRIREELGLVYSVYSYPATYSDIGLMTIYAGTNPAQLEKVFSYIIEELIQLKEKGISEVELSRIKEQMKGNYILSMEGTGSRMSALGKSELLLDRTFTQEEILEKIDMISMESFISIVDDVLNFERMAVTVLGNVNKNVLKVLESV
ncbi:MAG: putative zinc protease YmxG [Firmicutes bacterium]|nr:putative zinc protease YmxG [Bacillota bacterium]MDI6704728.1 pitrilysin family protein [Bacillota bacterium]